MKKTIITIAATLAFASAALAHPMHAHRGDQDMRGGEARAMAPDRAVAVIANANNAGGDPDPQVRLQLLRSAGIFDR